MADRLPLHDIHLAAGAQMAEPCGVLLPFSYGDPGAEYRAARGVVGIVDRTVHGIVEVTGRDRAAFLHAMLTNDVKSLEPGAGCGAAFLDAHGKVQFVMTVLALEDRIWLLVPAPATKLIEALDTFLFSEKAYFRDATGEFGVFMVLGPESACVVERLGAELPPEGPWRHLETRIEGVGLRIARGSRETGEPEIWLMPAAAEAARTWTALTAAGARPVGVTALDICRVEAGTPWLGHDVDDTVLLPEIPFEKLVSHSKGCYIGQEVVVRIRDRGHVNRFLTGLTLEGNTVPAPGSPVVVGDRQIGHLRSAVRSPGAGHPIALAYVHRAHGAPDTAVVVRTQAGDLAARVTALPFIWNNAPASRAQ